MRAIDRMPTSQIRTRRALQVASGKVISLDQRVGAIEFFDRYAAGWIFKSASFREFQQASATPTATLFRIASGMLVHKYILIHTNEFLGAAISAVTAQVNTITTATALGSYASAYSVFDPPLDDPTSSPPGMKHAAIDALQNRGAAGDVNVQLNITGGDGEDLTQGELQLWMFVSLPVPIVADGGNTSPTDGPSDDPGKGGNPGGGGGASSSTPPSNFTGGSGSITSV